MDWHQARACWIDAHGTEHKDLPNVGPGLTYARVTWLNDEGWECQTDGLLVEVNLEQVVVKLDDHAVSVIPRASVKRIESQWKTTAAPAAGSQSSDVGNPTPSLSSTKPTTSADCATSSGTNDKR